MFKIAKGRVSAWMITGAVLFMIIQVITSLYLPNLTSDIVNNGVAKGDVPYIWKTGFQMIAFALVSVIAAVGNVFIASKVSQRLGQRLRSDVYRKVINYSHDEMDTIGTSSLITRTTNDVTQIQNAWVMVLRMMIMLRSCLLARASSPIRRIIP